MIDVVAASDALDTGNDALVAGEWAAARTAFESVLDDDADGRVLEGLGRAYYGLRDYPKAISTFERAFARYRDEDDDARAAFIAARWLAWLYGGVHGNEAVSRGWLARAQRLLPGTDGSAERGWVELMQAAFAHEHGLRETCAREALTIAERFNDRDLQFCALAYLGECKVFAGRIDEGMALIDEALAACSAGEVADLVVAGEIYCKLFGVCELTRDVVRAEQWLSVVEDLGNRQNLIGITALCRTHYGGLLTAAGRWSEAEEELTAAARDFESSYRALRTNPLVRLADLRVRQGRLEEAAQLLAGLDRHPDAPCTLAALHLASGEAALAQDVCERALAQPGLDDSAAAPLLSLLVDAQLELEALEDARSAAERLTTLAERQRSDYARALAALARGRACSAPGTDEGRRWLEEALSGFTRAQTPLEGARTRLELARALADDRPEVAVTEARTALETFESLRSARHADAAAALLRSLGASRRAAPAGSPAELTKRESEILDLLGHGLTNQQIADRLYISPRTAEHHVGRILAKLGLKRRAEATAYVVRRETGDTGSAR